MLRLDGVRLRGGKELENVAASRHGELDAMRSLTLVVNLAQLLPEAMRFDAHHRVLGGIEVLRRPPEYLRREEYSLSGSSRRWK